MGYGRGQFWEAGSGGVAVVGGIEACGDGGINDVLRRREVGFACPEADHRSPSCLQRFRASIDREGR